MLSTTQVLLRAFTSKKLKENHICLSSRHSYLSLSLCVTEEKHLYLPASLTSTVGAKAANTEVCISLTVFDSSTAPLHLARGVRRSPWLFLQKNLPPLLNHRILLFIYQKGGRGKKKGIAHTTKNIFQTRYSCLKYAGDQTNIFMMIKL